MIKNYVMAVKQKIQWGVTSIQYFMVKYAHVQTV